MPVLIGLFGLLGWNYARHRRGLSTACSAARRFIGPRQMALIVLAAVGWFLPHYCTPFVRAVAELVDVDRPDPSNLPEEIQ